MQIHRIMILLLSALWFCFDLHGQEDPQQYAFERLDQAHDGQLIQIRGFIYQLPQGEWILAASPNLKSCCIGSESQAGSQIHVSWNNPPQATNSAILAQGTFHINRDLPLKRAYYLEKASIIEHEHSSWTSLLMIIFGLIGIAILFKRKILI